MKKQILFIIGILFSITVSGQYFNKQSSGLKIKTHNLEWSKTWEYCNLGILFNFDSDRITIDSREVQILDIEKYYDVENYIGYKVYVMQCNDTNYKKCIVRLFYYYDISDYKALHIEYSNIEYIYKLY